MTGVALALVTPWGLFRHYWVVVSLVATAVLSLVLVLHLPDVSRRADVARRASSAS